MLFTTLVFLLILSILVLIHELGHFVAAKKLGIKVEEFGFGFPPRLFGIKKGETIYSINWLPIGGFVKLYGEDGLEKSKNQDKDEKRAFYTQSPLKKSTVLLAGVFMNFTLAVVIISYIFTQGVMVPTNRVHIEKTNDNSPAQTAGLQKNDVINKLSIGKKEVLVRDSKDLIDFTNENLDKEIQMEIIRDGKKLTFSLVPRKDFPKDQGPLGVVISNYEEKKFPWWQAPIAGTKESIILSYQLGKGIVQTIWKLISFQQVSKDVAGPIGIAQMTGQAVEFGPLAVLELLGLLSLNLAIVNILPFPALDGGRLLFVGIEAVTGKKIKTNWERYVHQTGMIILLALMVLITVNDFIRIFSK